MSTLARFVVTHRRVVLAAWVAVLLAGVPNLGSASEALSQTFSVPGREGFETNRALLEQTGIDPSVEAIVPVTTLPAGTTVDSAGAVTRLRAAEEAVRRAIPGGRVAGYGSTGSRGFVSADGRTAFILAYPRFAPNQGFDSGTADARAVRKALGRSWHVSGLVALQDTGGAAVDDTGPGVLVEAVIGGAGALLVLAFVFASFLAVVPLLMAIFAIVAAFMAIWLITTVTEVSFIVTFLVALIGLGVCIDYALLLVMRWREERARGLANDEAIVRAMETAGSAIVFSGTTVAIGLLSLVVLPLPFLRSIGYAGMVIPLVSVVVALTLLPALLSLAGPRLDWPRVRRERDASRPWAAWGRLVVRRRWLAAAAGLAVILALAGAATQIEVGNARAETLARSGDAREGLLALERAGIGAGALTPFLVVGEDGAGGVASVDGVRSAIPFAGWRDVTAVVPERDANSSWGRSLNGRLKDATDARVGGSPAQAADFVSAVYGNFPLMIALVSLLTLLLLARAFRSLLLPLKAIVLNLLSVAAAWGVMVLVWQEGWGSDLVWGIPATGAITEFIPLMVFAFLYGLSMDYEVFILARIREEYDSTGSTDEAIVRGIGRTGRLVTSAALILFLSFSALGAAPDTILKVFATGLAAGIILDATVVRALTVPALVALFGRWNWWLPRPLARVLRVDAADPPPARSVLS